MTCHKSNDLIKAENKQINRVDIYKNLDCRANLFLTFENLMDALAFPPLIFREAPYRGPSVREKERPGVEVVDRLASSSLSTV